MMIIKKGDNWGELVGRPRELKIFETDALLGDFLGRDPSLDRARSNFAILKSNAARGLGLSGARPEARQMLRTSFDLIEIQGHEKEGPFTRLCVGYAILGNGFFRGRTVGIFNVSFCGGRDWAPRAHPNDGKLDVLRISPEMKVPQRILAYRRMKTGSHLPHPQISYHQSGEYLFDEARATRLTVDSVKMGLVEECSFRVIADALTLYW